MTRYANLGGNSNVYSYEIGDSYIRVKFNGTTRIYSYSYSKTGRHHVDRMKGLAGSGQGLNSYIMRNVKQLFD